MNILEKITGGIPHRELCVISAGRMTGKSYYTKHLNANMYNKAKFKIVASAIVDDEQWHTVITSMFATQVSKWLREQDPHLVTESRESGRNFIMDSMFDVHETIYTMMVLKFQ